MFNCFHELFKTIIIDLYCRLTFSKDKEREGKGMVRVRDDMRGRKKKIDKKKSDLDSSSPQNTRDQ